MGRIYIAAHKQFEVPDDPAYRPLFVGKSADCGWDGERDNVGDNISDKNRFYCELTGIYWLWKNAPESDYLGLVHYRRYFCHKDDKKRLTGDEIETLMEKFDAVLPRKRSYYIETCYSHYKHAHNIHDLDTAREVICELCPGYADDFDRVMKQRSIYIYNMFILKRDIFNRYCEWLFPILFELENRIDISRYDDYNLRVFGFIAERLFNVWLGHQQLHVCEMPVVFTEKQNLPLKYIGFVVRKFTGGRRYEKKQTD